MDSDKLIARSRSLRACMLNENVQGARAILAEVQKEVGKIQLINWVKIQCERFIDQCLEEGNKDGVSLIFKMFFELFDEEYHNTQACLYMIMKMGQLDELQFRNSSIK
jgi:hypothetical protein